MDEKAISTGSLQVTDIHLIRPLLRAVSRGELPARVLAELGLQHLLELCPHCREEFAAWQAEIGREASGKGEAYGGAFPPLAAVEREARERSADRRRAGRDLKLLLELPEAERLERVKRARRHFRGRTLVLLLIEESKRRRGSDAPEAYRLAEAARSVAYHSPQAPGVFGLIALATAHMGNALRAAGSLREAEEHFAYVRQLVRREGVVEMPLLAELDHLEGSLRKDQRLFPLAGELLNRAAMLYRLSGEKAGVGRVLLTTGTMHFAAGELDRAIEAARSALRRFHRKAEPFLHLCARHNLAVYLAEAGRYEEAAARIAADEDLYQQFADPWTALRLSWVKGKIAAAHGDSAAAEAAFLAAREGFAAQGVGYDAAMVSLDLALLYLQEGRTAELRRLAEEVAAIFAGEDVHREAAAALLLFHDAVRTDAATTQMVRELVLYLRAAQTDPSMRFGQAS